MENQQLLREERAKTERLPRIQPKMFFKDHLSDDQEDQDGNDDDISQNNPTPIESINSNTHNRETVVHSKCVQTVEDVKIQEKHCKITKLMILKKEKKVNQQYNAIKRSNRIITSRFN